MDMMSNISFGRDISKVNLNDLYKTHHEGIYTFEKSDSKLNKNYPVENTAGFIAINTNFDNTLCVQKITTFTQNSFFRTGTLVNNVWNWSTWDTYATMADIPSTAVDDLLKIYVYKEEYYPCKESPKINRANADTVFSLVSKVDDELDSISSNTYKFYGNIDENTGIAKLMDSVNTKTKDGQKIHKNFLLGYWYKENTSPSTSVINGENLPTREPGILQAFSSIIPEGETKRNPLEPPQGIDGKVITTWVFTEFTTGDVYVTQSLNGWYFDFAESDALAPLPVVPGMRTREFNWSKYSFSDTRTYNLNKYNLENRIAILRAVHPYLYVMPQQGTLLYSYRDGVNVVSNYFEEKVAWSDDLSVGMRNNPDGTPFNNSTIRSEKDFSIISHLRFNGTAYHDGGMKLSAYPNRQPFRFYGPDREKQTDNLLMTLYNTFRYTYQVADIRRYAIIRIEKDGVV